MPGVFHLPIVEVETLRPDVTRLALRSALVAGMAVPGQFVHAMVTPPGSPAFALRRPISIHCVEGDILHLLVKAVGTGTRWLAARRPGDIVDVIAPLGRGFDITLDGRHPVVVGGGIGCGPILFLVDRLRDLGAPATVILGARTRDEIYALERFEKLAQAVRVTTDDGSLGRKGLVTDILMDEIRENPDIMVFACGPEPMLREVSRISLESQIPVQVSMEALMACGVGACQSCVHMARSEDGEGYVRVCVDGPVFPAERIIW